MSTGGEQAESSKAPHRLASNSARWEPLSAADLRRRMTHIPADTDILLRLPSSKIKQVVLRDTPSISAEEGVHSAGVNGRDNSSPAAPKSKGKGKGKAKGSQAASTSKAHIVSLGKFGNFNSSHIVGMPFGHTYEVGDGDPAKEQNLRIVVSSGMDQLEETDATNQLINDDGQSQKLTFVEMQALKASGVDGRAIIQKQLESNVTYGQRTVYSQDKILKRKEAKHLKLFTPLAPSLSNLSAHNFERNAEKVRNLRPDALAQVLGLSGVRPGSRLLVVDGVGGAIVGACLDRMGGEGYLLAINDHESPPAFDLVEALNLPAPTIERVLHWLHWSSVRKEWARPDLPLAVDATLEGSSKAALERNRQRIRKRQALYQSIEDTRQELFAGNFDGIILATPYDVISILDRLLPYLGGSSTVVAHSSYLQPLIEAQARMRARPEFLYPTVTEPWLRRYQVLPGRTHPEMTTSATGGYLLAAQRVLTDTETASIVRGEKERASEGDAESEPAASVETKETSDVVMEQQEADKDESVEEGVKDGEDDSRPAKKLKTD